MIAASGPVILPIHCINATDIHRFLWLGIICTDNEEWEGHCKYACTVWRNEDSTDMLIHTRLLVVQCKIIT